MNRNYRLAKEYFNLQRGWVLHHKDPSLKYNDPERYNEWRPEDLVPMEKNEHIRFHNTYYNGMKNKHHSPETLGKISEASKGENNGMYGKQHSEETKRKMSEKAKERYKTHNVWNKGKTMPYKGKKHWKNVDGRRVYY